MSIEKLEVRTTLGTLLTLPLQNPSGYIIKDILGIDPVDATFSSTSLANVDGEQIQASRRGMRNIVLKLKYNPDYVHSSVRQLRTRLYSFFTTETEVNLRFYMLDGLTVDIVGRVESFDSPLFTQDPVVDISIVCPDPDFLEMEEVEVDGFTVATTSEFTIDYEGTVPTGILFTLNVDRSLTAFTIYHRPPDTVLRTFDFAASLVNADVLTINTVVGSKAITLTRAAAQSSLLYGKTPQSPWIELMPGENKFRIYAVGAGIPFTISYKPRHGGL